MRATLLALVAASLFQPLSAHAQQLASVATLSVRAGPYERLNVPVVASLRGVALKDNGGELRLYETTGGRNALVESQIRGGNPDEIAWILAGRTAANATRTFELRATVPPVSTTPPPGSGVPGAPPGLPPGPPPPVPARDVQVADDGNELHITIGGKEVLGYRYTPMPVPEGVREIFSSSAYIHPLRSPGGEVLTRIQPRDHYHHYGIGNPWTHTEFEQRSTDYWNLGSGQGRVRAVRVLEKDEGDVFGGFRSYHEHVDQRAPGGPKVALNEEWEVLAWNIPGEKPVWLVDFVSTLMPATEQPFIIKAYRYQGFSIRATEKWGDQTANILTSDGKTKADANATRARWVDVNGVSAVPEGRSGVLFLSNPANFNFPETLRVWPVGENRGVENVYVNFNPSQERDRVLMPGNRYALKYRMFVYDGRITPQEAERLWRDYADPPRVEVRPAGAAW